MNPLPLFRNSHSTRFLDEQIFTSAEPNGNAYQQHRIAQNLSACLKNKSIALLLLIPMLLARKAAQRESNKSKIISFMSVSYAAAAVLLL